MPREQRRVWILAIRPTGIWTVLPGQEGRFLIYHPSALAR